MTSIELTAAEAAILFVLMAEGRDVANTELKTFGPELKPLGREKLNRAGLVHSSKIKNRYFHTLTDDGWAWCATNLGADAPARATPASKALFTVLQGLDRHLRSTDTLVSEVFAARGSVVSGAAAPPVAAPVATQVDVEQRIRAAYHRLTPRPGGLVGLLELRAELAELDRTEVDRCLLALQRIPGVSVIPEPNQKTLTDDDRAAAVTIGGQHRHLIAITEA